MAIYTIATLVIARWQPMGTWKKNVRLNVCQGIPIRRWKSIDADPLAFAGQILRPFGTAGCKSDLRRELIHKDLGSAWHQKHVGFQT